MPERIFTTLDEEYTAASWLSTLKVMQRVGGRINDKECTAARLSSIVLHKPDEFLDEFSSYASQTGDEETTAKAFIREIGAISSDGRIVQGLNHAALLLCNSPISREIREQSSFARLVPLVDTMADYCDDKFLKGISPTDLKGSTYPTRLSYVRLEADLYIREYDGEPKTVAISPLYL